MTTDTEQLAADIKRVMASVDSHQDEYADIIRQLTDIVRVQHEAGNALAGMTKSDGMTRNEAMALWDAALALSAPLVKEEV